MWFKNIYSKEEGREKNFAGQEDAIDYDEEEQQRRDGMEDAPQEDNAAESTQQREDPSDEEEEEECPLDDTQVNEQIENILNNMTSDEEEEGEVVEDEIPYDRIETKNELNKEVILLNFYADMSSQRLTSLMSVFGKVKNSFIDDNEGVHVIFNSVRSSKRAKEFLDNLKVKNRRIQVIYGTYEERRDDPRIGGASAGGEYTVGILGDDAPNAGEVRGTPNGAYTTSHGNRLTNYKNGKTPVKLYKNRKYYLNTVPTHEQNRVGNNFPYNSQVKGMVPHVKTNTFFVPPSSSGNMVNEFIPPSELPFNQQEKAPMNNHMHNHHPDQTTLHDMPTFNNVSNYVQHPPPPPPPTSRTLYNQSFTESGRGSHIEPYPHYNHPNNPPGNNLSNHPNNHLGSIGTLNRMLNRSVLPPHVTIKKITDHFPNTFHSGMYKKNSFEAPPGNPPYVSYSNQPPTSSRNLHMKGVPPPPHGETGMTNPIGGNHPPVSIIPHSRDLPTASTGPLYNNSFHKYHPSNDQYHGGNMSYGNLTNSEDYPTGHGLYNNHEEYGPHSAHTMKPPKITKYGRTVKHSRYQHPLLAPERESFQNEEPIEYTPFNEDNPFGISEENKMVDNPTWNDRKTKQVLEWDQDASVEKNHLDFVDSFGSAKIFNRYLLVTDIPDHLDNENKLKEYISGLFENEKMRHFSVEVSLFVSVEVDEERLFKNATKGEHDDAPIKGEEEDAPVKVEEEDAPVKVEEATKKEEEAPNGEGALNGEDATKEEAEEKPKGAKRRGAKKAAAPKQRKRRGKAKEEVDQADQTEQIEQVQQVEQADKTDQTEQVDQVDKTDQAENPPPGKRYAHLTFRTIKSCVEVKKALEKNNFKVTFSAPSKANVCLWVGNLLRSYFVQTANVLKSMFMHFGPLKNVKYVSDKSCLFLQYCNVSDAIKARNHLYGLQVSNNSMLNIDFSAFGEWEGKQHKVSFTRKRLLDALAYDNGKVKERLESTLKKRNTGFIDSKVMHLLKKEGHHGSYTGGGGMRLKRHATDKWDDYNVKRRPHMDGKRSPSTSLHRRKYRSYHVDSYPNGNSASERTRGPGDHSRYDKRESRRSSKRKGMTTPDYSHHDDHHHDEYHHDHHDDHHRHYHHRRHKRRRSRNGTSADRGDAAGYNSPGEGGGSASDLTKGATIRDHAQDNTDSDFNSLDDIELNDYNDIQKTVSFYVNQKYKCDFISNFYDGNPELKIYPKLNVETKSDVQNLMNIRNSCTDYSVWQLGPTVKQKKKFLHICEHFSKKKNIPVIIDKNFTIFIVPMKEDYLKDLGIDNPDFMYAFVLQTKKA
ncbi:RNA-binding protein [Plasmodium coatneyi]|uniref:RNA-binding protein n=1 Tax=Plasmodium coatneyi TaxID=208452 RepID=A0A1B1DTU3_9APIC|nr:RNA-binding protein [Plasmodium coatneyi]ANQ06164.1 RNA-binding protein [Plasmodium coatneyi]